MGEEILRLVGVTRDYPLGRTVVHALCGVDLAVAAGEILAVMGPSGSGKSTLLHLMGALDTPSSGKVFLNGVDVYSLSEAQLTRVRGKNIGFVFQTFNLIPTLTAQLNVELPMIFQGVARRQRAERARELLRRVGLGERAHHHPSELSGGERQRVAIARALANDPQLILADEPTGNLDSETGARILALLREVCAEGRKTMVLVTHDPEAAAVAGRIIRLRDGRVVEDVRNG